MSFDVAEKNGIFGRIQCQRSEESSSREKGKKRVFLCRRIVRIKVRNKVIPASFLIIEGRGTLVRAKDRREREEQLKELVGYQNTGSEAPPMSKKGRERREQRNAREERLSEDYYKSNTFSPRRSEVPFESQKG